MTPVLAVAVGRRDRAPADEGPGDQGGPAGGLPARLDPSGLAPADRDRIDTDPVGAEDRIDRAVLKRRLESAILPLVAAVPPGPPLVVTASALRRRPDPIAAASWVDRPFQWKPALVRRSLGLAAVEACVDGRFRAPAEAVVPIVEEAVDEWRHSGQRHFHWEPWIAGLPAGGRAVVVADAVGWASGLWSSFEWDDLGPDLRFGGSWDQWTCRGPRPVVLKARPEVRFSLSPTDLGPGRPAQRPRPSLVAVHPGSPWPGWEGQLAYVALVGALAVPSRPVAARVQGLWPDAGIHRCVEIDASVLDAAVDQVVAALECIATTVTSASGVDDSGRSRSGPQVPSTVG